MKYDILCHEQFLGVLSSCLQRNEPKLHRLLLMDEFYLERHIYDKMKCFK